LAECFAAGFLAAVLDFGRDDLALADFPLADLEWALVALALGLLALALLDLFPIRPALTVVCVRE